MKITITIKNEQDGKSYDVSLDNRQKIATTLKVMSENLPEFMDGIGSNPAVQSERTSRHLNLEATYEESHIHTGDIVVLSQRDKEERGTNEDEKKE